VGNRLGTSPLKSQVGMELAGVPDKANATIYFFTYFFDFDVTWPVSKDVSLGLDAAAGPAWGTVANFSGFSIVPYTEAGVRWTSHLAPTLDFRLDSSYRIWWGTLQAVSASAAFDIWLGGAR
jgi:hypothetical protein